MGAAWPVRLENEKKPKAKSQRADIPCNHNGRCVADAKARGCSSKAVALCADVEVAEHEDE